MALSEIVKYEGDNSFFIWKYPHEDFNCLTELIVHESQEAIFLANGEIADVFGPGRYRLNAENIPVLTKLLNNITGTSIFHCEVYFVNKAVQTAIKWGTDSKVRFIEPTLGVPIELGASGEMNIAVSDGCKLLQKLVGTTKEISWNQDGIGSAKSMQTALRPLITTVIKTNLAAAIKQKNIDVVEVDEHLEELGIVLREKAIPGFNEYGLTICQFFLTTVVLPEDDPNFKKLQELHTITLQKRMASAEAEIKVSQAEERASYMSAESKAEASIKAAQREAILEEQTTEIELAKREAEKKIIQAQAEAQAAQIQGVAEAAVMQAKGYSQKDVLQAEVQKAYAEGIGKLGAGGSVNGGNSVVSDLLGVGVGLAALNAVMPQVGEAVKGIQSGEKISESANNDKADSRLIKCPGCGEEVPYGAKYCFKCGAKMTVYLDAFMICPACGKKIPKGKYCIDCGQLLIKRCSHCGTECSPEAKFCPECGTVL